MSRDKYTGPLRFGKMYHIYNRTNNKEPMFRLKQNFEYFMGLTQKYLSPVLDMYCYCLINNHFHYLVRIKKEEEIKYNLDIHQADYITISRQFSHLFNAYAKAFNVMFERNGSLFARPFRRIEVRDEAHLRMVVQYIHTNPVNHQLVKDINMYRYSSYKELLGNNRTWLARDQVMNIFCGKAEFETIHRQPAYLRQS